MHVQGIVQIDAGENGEDVSLEKGDQQFKAGQRDDEDQLIWLAITFAIST